MKYSKFFASVSLISLVFLNANAQAQDGHAEEGKGFGIGAVAGVLVGGPVGAAIGAGVGAWLGNRIAVAKKVEPLENQLATSNSDRHDLQHDLVLTRAELRDQQSLAAELRKRESELTGLNLQVLFRTGDAQLSDTTESQLYGVARVLRSRPDLTIEVDGYADQRGDEEYNMALSKERADVVASALQAAGTDAAQISLHAHGEITGRSDEQDADAYAFDRRVTLRFSKQTDEEMARNTQGN